MRLALTAAAFALLSGCIDLSFPDAPQGGTIVGAVDLQGRLPNDGVNVILGAPGGKQDTALTDADGGFAFTSLATGTYTLSLKRLPGFADLQVSAVVAPRQTVDVGSLSPLSQSMTDAEALLTGKVVVNGGGDPSGGEVEFITETTPAVTLGLATIGLSGTFVQRLPPGRYTLRASHPLYVTTTRTGLDLAPSEKRDLTAEPLVMDLNPATIKGSITQELEAWSADGGSMLGHPAAAGAVVTSDTGLTAIVDLAGNFELGGLPGGTRTLSVSLADHHDALPVRSVTVAPAQVRTLAPFELKLDRGSIIGQVRMGDGTPLTGVTVSIPGTPYSAAASADLTDVAVGRFTLTGVPPGAYALKAERQNYLSVNSATVNVRGDGSLNDVGTLPPLTRIQGDFVIDDADNTNTPGFTRVLPVQLKVTNVVNVAEYRVAEGNPSLTGVAFVPFLSSTIPFTLPTGDGAKTVFLQFKDNQNNLSGILSATIVLDTTAPSMPVVAIAGGAPFTRLSNNFPVTLTANETGSGLASMRLAGSNAVDGNGELVAPKVTYFRDSTFTRLTTGEGRQDVFVQFTDNAGNFNLAPASSFIVVDTVPPTGSLTLNQGPRATLAGYTDTVIADIDETIAAEPNGGFVLVRLVNEVASDLPNAALQATRSRTSWLLDTAEGLKTVHYQLVDAAGNAAAPGSVTIRYDATPPLGTAVLVGTSPTNNPTPTLTLTATDGANPLSPTTALTVSESPSFTGQAGASYPPGNQVLVTLSSADGPKTVYVRFRDAAGNTSVVTVPLTLDRTAPLGALSLKGTLADGTVSETLTANAQITVNFVQSGATLMQLGNESLTSCASGTYVAITGSSISNHLLTGAAAPREVRVCFKDDAGNTVGPLVATIGLDLTTPSNCQLALSGVRPDGTPAVAGKTARPEVTATFTNCSEPPTQMFLTTSAVTCAAATPLDWVPFAASSTFLLSGPDALYTVRGCVRDAARNTGSVLQATLTLDTTAPVPPPNLVIDNGAPYVNLATYTARAMQLRAPVTAAATGATEWALSESPSPTAWMAFAPPFDFTFGGTGPRVLYARFRDDVGNTTGVVAGTIHFDITPPATTSLRIITPTANAFTNSVSVVVQLDGTLTDATQVTLAQAGGAGCVASDFVGVSARNKADLNTFLLTSGDGPKVVCGLFTDVAGNPSSTTVSAAVTLDTVAPTTPQIVTADTAQPLADNALFSVSISGASTDLAFARYEIVGGKTSTWTAATLNSPLFFRFNVINDGSENGFRNELRVRAIDQAGNISGDTGMFLVADTNAPESVGTSPVWLDNGSGRGTVVWTPSSSSDVVAHDLYYDSAGQDPLAGSFAVEGLSPIRTTNATTFTLSGLANGATTYVRVRPIDHAGNAGPFAPLTGSPPLQLQPNEVSVNQFAQLALPPSVKRISRMVLHGDLLFVGATLACNTGAMDSALAVVDVSALSSPIANGAPVSPAPPSPTLGLVQTFTDAVACQQSEFPIDLQVVPPYLLMTSGTKLRIFSIAVPTAPALVTTIDFTTPLTALNVVGDRAFVTQGSAGMNHVLWAVNLSKLWDNNAATLPTFATDIIGSSNTFQVGPRSAVASRDRIIATQSATSGTQIDTFGITNTLLAAPTGPTYVMGNQVGFSMPARAVAGGSYLYQLSSVGGLTVYDLTSAWSGGSGVTTAVASTGYTGGGQFEVVGDQVFAADQASSRFRSFELSDLSNPLETGTYSLGNAVAPTATVVYGNYAIVAVDTELRFLELANPRGLRSHASAPGGFLTRAELGPGFVGTGGSSIFDLHQGEAPVKGNPGGVAVCNTSSTRFGEVEAWAAGNNIRMLNLERNMDRNGATSAAFGPDGLAFAPGANIRVGGVAAWGNFLVAAEHRNTGVAANDGLWLEVFDVRPVLNRQQATAPVISSRGAFRVSASYATGTTVADVFMHRGRAVVTVNTTFSSNPGATGNNVFIVDIRNLFDDNSATVVPATAVQGTIAIYKSRYATVQGRYVYIAHSNGVSIVDISAALDEDPATLVPASPTRYDLLSGQAMDSVFVAGSTLVASGQDTLAGLYSVDITNPAAPVVQAAIPLSSGFTQCDASETPGVPRQLRTHVTVKGTRAYVLTNQTLRVIDLE